MLSREVFLLGFVPVATAFILFLLRYFISVIIGDLLVISGQPCALPSEEDVSRAFRAAGFRREDIPPPVKESAKDPVVQQFRPMRKLLSATDVGYVSGMRIDVRKFRRKHAALFFSYLPLVRTAIRDAHKYSMRVEWALILCVYYCAKYSIGFDVSGDVDCCIDVLFAALRTPAQVISIK
jgi:hypothetical protein